MNIKVNINYKFKDFIPLIIIFSVILCITFARQVNNWNFIEACYDFMAIFFIIFGAFKLFNLSAFAEAYLYDIIARRSKIYAYVYPFIEIGLGLAYFFRWHLTAINCITFVLMIINAIGVTQALLKKEPIVCACLGVVFKIPMTYVTLFEDLLMALMALAMLIYKL